jgi:hypothetical protein
MTSLGSSSASKKKVKVDIMKRFLEPNFSMFETRQVQFTVDEFGASVDDLQFGDIQSADGRR